MAQPIKVTSLEETSQGTALCKSGTLSVLSNNAVSIPILIPSEVKTTCCGLSFLDASSSGRFEYTLSHPDAVEHDRAIWRDWPNGDVTDDAANLLVGPVIAVRAVCVTGTLTYEVTGS